MRKILPFLIIMLIVGSCDDEPVKNQFAEVDSAHQAEYMTQAIVGINSTIQSTLLAVFEYPQLHGLDFEPVPNAEVRSSSCPDISPDPNDEVVSFPVTYTIDFGSAQGEPSRSSCELSPTHRTSGQVEVILDGQFCAQDGASIKIRPNGGSDKSKHFYVNGLKCFIKNDDGCINLKFAGRDSLGNMCFAADLSDICIYNPRNKMIVSMYQWDDSIIKICDNEQNDNFNDPSTLLDNELKISFSHFYCGYNNEITRVVSLEDPTNPWDNPLLFGLLCSCPMGGGMNMGTTTVSWDSCDGQANVNNTPMNMGACSD